MDEEDEDVVLDGSPLHDHLVREGLAEATTSTTPQPSRSVDVRCGSDLFPGLSSRRRFLTPVVVWPRDADIAELEIEVAQRILSSDLLVQEDEDFVSNFILTEDALERYRQRRPPSSNPPTSSSPAFGEALVLTGSLAAAAAAVFCFSSVRTRVVATAVAVLPAAFAAISASIGHARSKEEKKQEDVEDDSKERLQNLVDQMLQDMKAFKQLMRKSLNLIQGMELMRSGFTLAVDAGTGAASATSSSEASAEGDDRIAKVSGRQCLPALRRAAREAAVHLIKAYRESVEGLMKVSPLADHVDLREHYIAFVELRTFGIDDDGGGGEGNNVTTTISVKDLRDVVQLGLVQQSEYLRRFALAFSERVREDHKLDKSGLLNQSQGLVDTLQKISAKLSRVLEYHQAMGVVRPEERSRHRRRQEDISLVPLRSVYTSLFSTGLHLQNSLLRVRQLEKVFDSVERLKSREVDVLSSLFPSDDHLAEWLRGFEAIQSELNACVGCLDDGMAQIDYIKVKDAKVTVQGDKKSGTDSKCQEEEVEKNAERTAAETIDDSTVVERLDEVFEAVIHREPTLDAEEKYQRSEEEEEEEREMDRQSRRLLKELRVVLVDRVVDRERREKAALARMENGSDGGDAFLMNNNESSAVDGKANGFDDSFSPQKSSTANGRQTDWSPTSSSSSSSSSNSSSSDQATVKSVGGGSCGNLLPIPNGRGSVVRSFSGSALSDDGDRGSDNSASCSSNSEDDDDEAGQGIVLSEKSVNATTSVDRLPNSDKERCYSLSELRSLSSPDLKQLAKEPSSSPYVSLERIQFSDPKASSSSGEDSNGSADEMHHQVLKTYRRPLRPAAASSASASVAARQSSHRRRSKRDRNKTVIVSNGDVPGMGSRYLAKVEMENGGDNQLFFPPSRPLGFGASIAIQAAMKAKGGNGTGAWQKQGEEDVFEYGDT